MRPKHIHVFTQSLNFSFAKANVITSRDYIAVINDFVDARIEKSGYK